jgi:asparagine synthase (glutamine-hydrolysing)
MGAIVALAGWPAAEPPADAWRARLGADLPIALVAEPGIGPPVVSATSADGRLHVVVAGTLANRRELDETIDRTGAQAGGRNHAALVLRLYEGRGEQSVSALRGAFAVALWDGRRGRLVLARDQLGVQSLYYAAARGHCVAATRLGPLLAIPGLAGAPDVALVDVLLALGTVPAPATAYPGIRQLHAGELLVWEPGRLRAQRYWQLRFPEARDSRRTVARESVRRVREQLEEAFRIRVSGVVSGMLLSGGLGAGSVLGLATALDRRPAAAVTVEGDDADDLRRAAALAQRAGVEHVIVRPDLDWGAEVERALAVHGAPIGGMDEPLLGHAVAALGSRARVVLLGCGAEETLGGGPAERTWAACERYRALPGLAREAVDILAGIGWPRGLARTVSASRNAPIDVFAGIDVSLDADARRALYGPELRRMLDGNPIRGVVGALGGDAVSQGATDALDLLFAVRLAIGIPRDAGRLANSVAGEIELGFPLADPRVVQTSAAVPARVRASIRRRADLLQHAVTAELPRDVQRQPHRALRPPPAAWERGSLRALLDDVLDRDHVARLGIFDPDGVARLRAAHAAGAPALGGVLWRLVLMSRWLDRPAHGVGERYSSAPSATSAVIASSS